LGLNKEQLKKQKSIIDESYNLFPLFDFLCSTNHQDTLAIFDVDDVLITPSSEDDLRHPYRNYLLESILSRLNPEEVELLKSSIFLNTKQVLVESRIEDIFEYLISQKIPSIALTAMGTGKLGIIKKMHDFRVKQLDSVMLSLSPPIPLHGEHIMVELTTISKRFLHVSCKGHPMLTSGIIFTSGLDKGLVLKYIFKKYDYYPKTVIFVDDLIENIESLKQLCFELNINFYGFHYKAASLIPLPTINEDLEKLRFAILEKEFTWLSLQKLQDKNYSARLIV
jgi:Protein of unknown function (DUF2608)